MKIIQLLSQIELTGAEVHSVRLAESLKDKGHQCFIFSDELHISTNIPFFPLRVHRTKFLSRISSILKLRRFILENKVDIVHAHSREIGRAHV